MKIDEILVDGEEGNMANLTASDKAYVYGLQQGIESLKAELERKRELLKEHQWAQGGYDGWPSHCPECFSDQEKGHAPDCRLAREIKTGENQ